MRCSLFFLLFLATTPAWAGPATPYRGKVFLGIAGETVALPEDPRYESTHGIELTRVAAGSSGEGAGLAVGDTVVSVDGKAWTNEQIRLSRSFGKAGDRATPGESVPVVVLRAKGAGTGSGEGVVETVQVELLPYPRTAREVPAVPTNAELRPDLVAVRPAYQQLCLLAIEEAGFAADCQDLLARIERCEQFPDPDRLPLVRYVHRDPFKLEAIAREMTGPIEEIPRRGVADLSLFLVQAENVLVGFGRRPDERPTGDGEDRERVLPEWEGGDLNRHLDYVEAVLGLAHGLHKKAFAGIDAGTMESILSDRAGMLASFIEHKMLSYDDDHARQTASLALLDAVSGVDVPALLEQAKAVSLLVSPAFTMSLRQAAIATGKDLNAAVVAKRQTPFGPVLVAGRNRTRYQGADYAAVFELGGDDVYANNQGASIWGSIASAVLVDYGGDDAYETHEAFRQGCGDMGVGILADLDGDDTYIGMEFTQGVGFMGVGVLIDEAGDDTYRGIQFHQGLGQWGVGMLVDRSGRDRYESHMASQGVGIPGGFGLLYDGGEEADSYYCKGNQGTGYGTPGVYEGWGQGMGFGFRPYASGGVGLLIDHGGADHMEAGNFSQGGGYFYGFGVLYSGGTDNDHYIGSRYAQGFGCHQAAGVMIEAGGNDRYSTRHAVAQGLAWDEAVALFLECGGDDIYEGGGFSQGASAMNGWTLFIEMAGKDTYLFTDQARAGGNTYHGGTSLSFFVDAGGDEDAYPKRTDNSFVPGGERSLFLDLPGSMTDAVARGKPGQ